MARRDWLASAFLTGALALTVWSCGGDGSPSAPSDGGGGTPPVETTTVTITGAGVTPKSIVVNAGARINFINNDNRTHQRRGGARVGWRLLAAGGERKRQCNQH